jgi:hypothetical protein
MDGSFFKSMAQAKVSFTTYEKEKKKSHKYCNNRFIQASNGNQHWTGMAW